MGQMSFTDGNTKHYLPPVAWPRPLIINQLTPDARGIVVPLAWLPDEIFYLEFVLPPTNIPLVNADFYWH